MTSQPPPISSSSSASASASQMAPLLLQLWMRFPQAARQLWDAGLWAHAQVQRMSPDVREKAAAAALWLAGAALWLWALLRQVYTRVMRWPDVDPAAWSPPTPLVLRPLASVILWVLPVVSVNSNNNALAHDQDLEVDKRRRMYIANSAIFSLDSLPLAAFIYTSTGRWPRRQCDRLHFTIPVWKHLIEYFGAFPDGDSALLARIMEAGHPVLIHPGGRRESLPKKEDFMSSNASVSGGGAAGPTLPAPWSRDRSAVLDLAMSQSFTVVPLAAVGISNDMIRILFDLNIEPLLWLIGAVMTATTAPRSSSDSGTNDNSSWKDGLSSVPVPIPVSYQRIYVHVSAPIDPQDIARHSLMGVENAVRSSIASARDVQSLDPKRYLLDPLWDAFEGGKQVAQDLSSRFEQGMMSGGGGELTPAAASSAASEAAGTKRRKTAAVQG